MAIEQMTYEEYMKKLDELEKRYRSDEKGFPPGAKQNSVARWQRAVRRTLNIGLIRFMGCPCINPSNETFDKHPLLSNFCVRLRF